MISPFAHSPMLSSAHKLSMCRRRVPGYPRYGPGAMNPRGPFPLIRVNLPARRAYGWAQSADRHIRPIRLPDRDFDEFCARLKCYRCSMGAGGLRPRERPSPLSTTKMMIRTQNRPTSPRLAVPFHLHSSPFSLRTIADAWPPSPDIKISKRTHPEMRL